MGIHARGRARVDPDNPSAFGICDRCKLQWNLRDLAPQYQWQGNTLVNLGILVCPDCMDEPSDFLRVPNVSLDPLPLYNIRPENYSLDEKSNWTIQPFPGTKVFAATSNMAATINSTFLTSGTLTGASSMSAEILRTLLITATLSDVSSMTATATWGATLDLSGQDQITTESHLILTTLDGKILVTQERGIDCASSMTAVLTQGP